MAKRAWFWFLLAFTLSCINKETSLLFTFVFAIYFRDNTNFDRVTFWSLLSLQGLIFMTTRGALAWIFRLNPGTPLEFHLLDHNLGVLTQAYTIQTAICWLMVATLAVHEFYSKPRLLKVWLWMLLPLLIGIALFGFLDELRVCYEIYPAVLLLGTFSLFRILVQNVQAVSPEMPAV